MKKIITSLIPPLGVRGLFIFYFLFGECFSQAGEWVWIKGDSIPNQSGNYGVQGVPSPTNNPPSLYEPCEWTDMNGNFWLFGGVVGSVTLNNLWKFEISSNEWTWMKGPGIANDSGSYGIQGIPSLLNNPPSRGFAIASWVDNQNNLWLFGGAGLNNMYSDLWKYDISTNEWVWVKGPNSSLAPGVYGIQGVPDTANYPRHRSETLALGADDFNNLWLFGGATTIVTQLNDLWRYSIDSNQWTWMKGSNMTNAIGVYGTLGVESPANTPGARGSYGHWKDSDGKFWFFGGNTNYGNQSSNCNDLWKYNPVTNNWKWMGGSTTVNAAGVYGTKCVTSSANIPGARYENRAAWKDQRGNFWLFGGGQYPLTWNDLWMYCISTNQWIWQSGSNIPSPVGSWGTIGVSSPTNKPNGRGGAIGWTDNNGHLYLFGGSNNGLTTPRNDLWKYTIDTTCGVCPTITDIREINFANELLVFPNPTNSSLTISFQSSSKQYIELRIYNTLGKQIYVEKEEIAAGKFEKKINVEKLSDGIYFLQVKMKEGVISKKVVVQH
ncbi:MAG: kelch repeat-containing protein [Bacteroidia bacterium]